MSAGTPTWNATVHAVRTMSGQKAISVDDYRNIQTGFRTVLGAGGKLDLAEADRMANLMTNSLIPAAIGSRGATVTHDLGDRGSVTVSLMISPIVFHQGTAPGYDTWHPYNHAATEACALCRAGTPVPSW